VSNVLNNPFRFDGPLSHDSIVYLRRGHDVEDQALQLLERMDWFTINEPRQSGKTSLILWLRSQQQLLDAGCIFSSIDMSMLSTTGSVTEETWYRALYRDLLNEITGRPSYAQIWPKEYHQVQATMQANTAYLFHSEAEWPSPPVDSDGWRHFLFYLAEYVAREKKRLIIVLDRMKQTHLQSLWINGCFRALRNILDKRQVDHSLYSLAFILVGTYDVNSLISSSTDSNLDLQGIGLPDFSKERVKELVTHLQLSDEGTLLSTDRIYYWTAGHPYLTQLLCYHLAELPQLPTVEDVDSIAIRLCSTPLPHFSAPLRALREPDLKKWIERLLRGDKPKFSTLIPAHLQLKLLGLIKTDDNFKCTIRNQLYKKLLEDAFEAIEAENREVPGYADLEISLFAQNANRYKVALRFTRPYNRTTPMPIQGTARFNFKALLAATSDSAAYGNLLTKSLFKDQGVLGVFRDACTITQILNNDLRLRLFIYPDASKLHDLRWETLLHPMDNSRLLTNERILFSRFLGSHNYRLVQLASKDDLRALVVIANPTDITTFTVGGQRLAEVKVEHVLDTIGKSLGTICMKALFSTPESPGRATLENLIEELRDGFNILYLVCHGAISTSSGKKIPRLWLEASNGSADVIPAQVLVDRLKGLSQLPQLVVLASCQSAGSDPPHTIDEGETLTALGPSLVQAGIPAVVGMHGDVFMTTLTKFMDVFFRELLRDGRIDRAMTAARSTVVDRSDWWIPVLFTQLSDGLLWSTPAS